jgi:serine/threonine protein kinase
MLPSAKLPPSAQPQQTRTPDSSADSPVPVTEPYGPQGGAAAEPLPMPDRRYRVECFLAQGGMGAVYRILDADFKRPLALKVLHASSQGKTHLEEPFLREARLTGRLYEAWGRADDAAKWRAVRDAK